MFKFFFFAALVAIASAKPHAIAPLAYTAPVVSTYGSHLVSAYGGYPAVPAYKTYGAYPAVSVYKTYSAYPAVTTYGTAYPAVSTYGAYSSPLIGAYSPLAYHGYAKYY